MGFGSIVSGIAGLIGDHQDREFARAQSAADRAFQKEVYQNQLQWKAADAKKAGLHPLAVIGGGAYSASPSSQPSASSTASALGKLGEGIGDAFTAYMNKDEIAAEKAKRDAEWNKQMDLLDAQINEIRQRTRSSVEESISRSLSHSRPFATGREYISGQVEARPDALPPSNPGSAISIRAMPSRSGSAFAKAYDINASQELTQERGDELGQLYNALEKATRENKEYFFDPATGRTFRFSRKYGEWYEVTGGGGGI